jgi:hypothetical protein
MYIQIKSVPVKIAIFLFPLFFTAIVLWLRFYHFPIYEIIGTEDHIIEYSQFFFFLAGGIVAFLIALKLKKFAKPMFFLFLIISFALIFVAGEEISWGERLLNINAHQIFDGETELPLLEYNVQSEMNIHNFKPIHKMIGTLYLIIGSYFVFSWILIKIIGKFWCINKRIQKILPFFIPPPVLTLYFVPTAINLFDRIKMGFTPQDYEMVEFLLSLGILIFLILCYMHLKKEFKILEKV